jgi:hypothetical protein
VSSTAPPSPSARQLRSGRRRPAAVTQLRDLVVSYFKQQTILPLAARSLHRLRHPRSLLPASACCSFRHVGPACPADETGDTFTGDWSWVPYRIMFVVLLCGAAVVWVVGRANRGPEKEFG